MGQNALAPKLQTAGSMLGLAALDRVPAALPLALVHENGSWAAGRAGPAGPADRAARAFVGLVRLVGLARRVQA